MFSIGIVGLLIILGLFFFGAWFLSKGPEYPEEISIGGVTVKFSQIDKICYTVAMVSVMIAVLTGTALIWGPDSKVLNKIVGTSALFFAGSVLTLVLNRLMRGRAKPN